MKTNKIYNILQLLRAKNSIEEYFNESSKSCEHHVGGLCQIPVELYPTDGLIICELNGCPLDKIYDVK